MPATCMSDLVCLLTYLLTYLLIMSLYHLFPARKTELHPVRDLRQRRHEFTLTRKTGHFADCNYFITRLQRLLLTGHPCSI